MSNFLTELDNWVLESVKMSKQAEERGDTSHPSEKAEDGNQAASTGARASEHEKDIKAQVPGQTVNEAKGSDVAGPGRGENSPSFNTVTKSRATGEDAAVETASAKGKPEDPGTSHPAKADMGEKFSMVQLIGIGNDIMADVAVASAIATKQAELPPALAAVVEEKKEDKAKSGETSGETSGESSGETSGTSSGETSGETDAKVAGKEAAAAVIGALKQPVVSASDVIDSVIKQASADADNVADFLAGYLSKQAAPADGVGGGEVMAETSQGAEAPQGAPAGAGGEEAQMEQVVQALLQAGVSPEELMALIQGQGAGAEAGAAPAGGADMAAAAPEAAPAAGGI